MGKVAPENYELDKGEKGTREKKHHVSAEALHGSFNGYLIMCLGLAVLGSAFQFGWGVAVFNTPSDVIKAFYSYVNFIREGKVLTDSELNFLWSITNGLFPLGGVFGGLSSGFVADYFGRKKALFLVNIFVIITVALNVMSKYIDSYETIMAGKFFTGVFSGFFTGILPLYLSEIAPINLRGLAGTMNQLTIVLAILIANIFGLKDIFGNSLWPVLAGAFIVPVIPSALLYFFGVDSPKFLFINKNDEAGAKEALTKLRNNDMRLVEAEIEALQEEKDKFSKLAKVKWGDFINVKTLKRPLIVALVLQLSQKFGGINAVMFYSTDIFKKAGLEDDWPVLATILLGVVQLIMTFVCLVLIDRAGRKKLLLIGNIGMGVSCFGLAIFGTIGVQENIKALNYLTVVSALLYIVFFSIGPGAIPWLITAELFKSDSRGKATSIAVFVNWFSDFIVAVSFPFIDEAIGSYSFIIFGVLLIFFSLFTLFFVPETKGKSVDDIVDMFEEQYIFLRSF